MAGLTLHMGPLGTIWDEIRFLISPKTAEIYYNRAIDLYQNGRYEKALALLAKGESLNSELSVIPYTKGLCYQKLEKVDEAKKAFQLALKLHPEDQDALYNLSRLYYNEGDLDTALAYVELAETLVEEPGDPHISYLMGLIYEQQGRVDEAVAAYEKSLSLNPDQLLVGIFLSKLYTQQHQYPKAIELLRHLLELDNNNLDINYELSLCLAKTGDWDETIHFCKRVIEIEPGYTKGYNQLGLAMYCTERLEEAVGYYEKALELDPQYATAINNLAYTYEKLKNYAKAIENFTAYLKFTDDKPEEKAEIEQHIELLKQKMAE